MSDRDAPVEARVLSRMRMRGLVDHEGAEWSRVKDTPATAGPAPTPTDARPRDPVLRCSRCDFQAKTVHSLKIHVAKAHRASRPAPRRASSKPAAPVTPKAPPPAPPVEPVLERLRRVRDAATEAVQALEALKAAGFVI